MLEVFFFFFFQYENDWCECDQTFFESKITLECKSLTLDLTFFHLKSYKSRNISTYTFIICFQNICSYLNTGDPKGKDWLPAECDVSIRDGWFWHKSESPKKLSQLLEIYYNSVGRNCVLLLNVPPNSTGLIAEEDARRLKEFRRAIDKIFSTNLVESCLIQASSIRGGKEGGFGPENVLDDDHLWTYWAPRESDDEDHWIELRGSTDGGLRFNVVRIQEAIGLGQRVKRHEVYLDGKMVANGTTIGYKRLHRLEEGIVHGRVVRIRFKKSRGLPLISSIGLHFDPYWHPNK